ncbi:hypothetical protein [Burkholderia ubonensis]|uniref:hypothetical protein n=1 Tax=Burkholderia ubonensis TaxID=101571 RepID=UPI000AD3DCE3|nr:hypothetical protein [Burkholderia ubonensis]
MDILWSLVIIMPFAMIFAYLTQIVIGASANTSEAPRANAHERHAERLYQLNLANRRSLVKRYRHGSATAASGRKTSRSEVNGGTAEFSLR